MLSSHFIQHFSHQYILFQIVLLICCVSSQSTNPKSRTDQICILGSKLSFINGIYKYSHWDSNKNGSIYYNAATNKYLYPWIYSFDNKDYFISSDPTKDTVSSYCNIPTNENVFDPDDCFNGNWISYNGTTWISDTDLILINCNDICISGNDNIDLDGTYKWSHYNTNRKTSIYKCTNCEYPDNIYLYGHINVGNRQWHISSDYNGNIPISRCLLNSVISTDRFDLNDCIEWNSYIDNKWRNDDMIIQKCADDGCYRNTRFYGSIGGTASHINTTNEDEVIGISSWGIFIDDNVWPFTNAIGNFTWISYNFSDYSWSEQIGYGPSFISCDPFIVEIGDYINGYRVIYDTYIYGLYFYTFNNRSYGCIGDINTSDYFDSGIVLNKDYYLSGFEFHAGWIIDAILFQFTSIYQSCSPNTTIQSWIYTLYQSQNPTMDPTAFPTINPTIFPTSTSTIFPTVYPTTNPAIFPPSNPTIFPTIYPTTNPTTFPTSNPIMFPTSNPTQNPTVYPTTFPTINQRKSDEYHETTSIESTESIEIKIIDDGNIFDEMTNTEIIIIGICFILFCCICPLLIGIVLCYCIYKGRNKLNHQIKPAMDHNQPKQDKNVNTKEIVIELPKLQGLADHDSLKLKLKSSENVSNNTLNVEGYQQGTTLQIIDSADQCILSKAFKEIMNIPIVQAKLNLNGNIDSELSDGMYEN